MKILGIAIKKNEIWYSVVSGEQMDSALLIETGKQIFRADLSTQSLMIDFSNIFTELITRFCPDRVVYRLHLDSTIQQIPYMHFSLGILNLVCQQSGIVAKERSNKWITAGKRAKINKFELYFTDKKFNNEEMAATLIAWFELEC